jgi:hypothetical protein
MGNEGRKRVKDSLSWDVSRRSSSEYMSDCFPRRKVSSNLAQSLKVAASPGGPQAVSSRREAFATTSSYAASSTRAKRCLTRHLPSRVGVDPGLGADVVIASARTPARVRNPVPSQEEEGHARTERRSGQVLYPQVSCRAGGPLRCVLAALGPAVGRASAATVVSLTFDDGRQTQYAARASLAAHGMHGDVLTHAHLTGLSAADQHEICDDGAIS